MRDTVKGWGFVLFFAGGVNLAVFYFAKVWKSVLMAVMNSMLERWTQILGAATLLGIVMIATACLWPSTAKARHHVCEKETK